MKQQSDVQQVKIKKKSIATKPTHTDKYYANKMAKRGINLQFTSICTFSYNLYVSSHQHALPTEAMQKIHDKYQDVLFKDEVVHINLCVFFIILFQLTVSGITLQKMRRKLIPTFKQYVKASSVPCQSSTYPYFCHLKSAHETDTYRHACFLKFKTTQPKFLY